MRERKTAWPKLTEQDNYFSKTFCKINCTEVEEPSKTKFKKKIFGSFKEVGERKKKEMVLCP